MMIQWLNQNQGFVMSILTAVYVLATVVIVIYNRKSIKEMQNSRESESRPYIFANLQKDPRDMCFYLRIQNYGKSGAKINDFYIFPDLKLVENDNGHQFLQNVILAPNQILQFIVLEKWEITTENTYSFSIQYSSVGNSRKEYEEKYTLTVEYAHQMGYTDNKTSNMSDEANALKNIANHLDSIRNKM